MYAAGDCRKNDESERDGGEKNVYKHMNRVCTWNSVAARAKNPKNVNRPGRRKQTRGDDDDDGYFSFLTTYNTKRERFHESCVHEGRILYRIENAIISSSPFLVKISNYRQKPNFRLFTISHPNPISSFEYNLYVVVKHDSF